MKYFNLLSFLKIQQVNLNLLFYLTCVLYCAKCQNSRPRNCELNRNRPLEADEAVLFIEDIATDVIVKVTSKGYILGKVPPGYIGTIAVSVNESPVRDILPLVGVSTPAAAAPYMFLSVPQVITFMSQTEKQVLTNRIECIMHEIEVTDFAAFIAQVTNSSSLRDRVIQAVKNYIQQEL